jgi:hypothetical protein
MTPGPTTQRTTRWVSGTGTTSTTSAAGVVITCRSVLRVSEVPTASPEWTAATSTTSTAPHQYRRSTSTTSTSSCVVVTYATPRARVLVAGPRPLVTYTTEPLRRPRPRGIARRSDEPPLAHRLVADSSTTAATSSREVPLTT